MTGIRPLLDPAKCVLLDFEGPVGRLFTAMDATRVTSRLCELLQACGESQLVGPQLRAGRDPLAVLRTVAEQDGHRGLTAYLDRRLTEEELGAVRRARPTPYADPLIRTLVGGGRRVAVTSEHSVAAVRGYLALRGLERPLGGRIYARPGEGSRWNGYPEALRAALESCACAPEEALWIGETPAVLAAARAAGVPFLGYARDEAHQAPLADRGSVVTRSLEEVLRVASVPRFD
ncbi:HAD family hydrolase [Streptomyces sp. NPDC005438]|uniref:HAD family hydrolase n=1 Tax=Streptomyces sp. NPDC005438 TaxID=3156880 RepID=UPI0033B6A8D1